jgi:hypothetical protein
LVRVAISMSSAPCGNHGENLAKMQDGISPAQPTAYP